MQMKLFKVLIGATPPGRHTEQHDVFFGIAENLTALVPQIKKFWPEAIGHMHLDAFRTVTKIDNYQIEITTQDDEHTSNVSLFFINLGGYKPNEFDEFHYKMVVAAADKSSAIAAAKQTAFYKHTGFVGAPSHIDDKYGIDVDDVHAIDDILSPELKKQYKILVTPCNVEMPEDTMHLGYFKMSKIENGDLEPS